MSYVRYNNANIEIVNAAGNKFNENPSSQMQRLIQGS